jgi:hypothetical protein
MSIHILCHLDSPSATNLPCLGLQQQTGPKVSGLCGSYRVPSKSSLLPLHTLSPGENRSQVNKPPTQSSTAWPHNQWKNSHGFFPQAQQWKNGLGSWLWNIDLMHKLDLGQWMHTDSPDTTWDFSIQIEVKPALSESVTGFSFSTEVYTGFSVQRVYEVFLQSSGQSYCSRPVHPQEIHLNERVNPPHGPPKPFYSHAPGSTLVALETACIPPACIPFPWSGT